MNITQPTQATIDTILRLTVTKDTASNGHLIVVHLQSLFTISQGHGHLGHAQCRARLAGATLIRAVENNVRHLTSSQSFGRCLTQHPTDCIHDV